MKLSQFIQENEVTAFQIVPSQLILNVMVGDSIYGLDVDVSNIMSNIPLLTKSNFNIEGTTLSIMGLTLNIEETDLLGYADIID